MRKPVIAGNWKLFKTSGEAVDFVNSLLPLVKDINALAATGKQTDTQAPSRIMAN